MLVQQQPKPAGLFGGRRKLFLLGVGIGAACVALAVAVLLILAGGGAKPAGMAVAGQAVAGQTVTLEADIVNGGLLSQQYKAVLLVDGKKADEQTVTLKPKETVKVKFKASGLAAGAHTAALGNIKQDIRVLRPASFTVSDIAIQPENPLPGADITVTATVSNTGEVKGKYNAEFMQDGFTAATQAVDVEPGGQQTVTGTLNAVVRGAHTVSLGEAKKEFEVLAPADISVAGLELSADTAKPGETVTATVTLKNSGDLSGSYKFQLLVNGAVAGEQEVTVKGNGSEEYDFNITQSKGGSYTVQAGDCKETLRILQITRPANGAFLVRRVNKTANRITITNKNSTDVIVVLAKKSTPGTADISVYVRAGATVTVKGIPNGDYYLCYSSGSDYDAGSKTFYTNPSYLQSDSIYNFSASGGRYTIWTITLYTASGNSTASNIDGDSFPK